MGYRWATPFEWLEDADISREELLQLIRETVDPDDIQDRFQSEMEKDGYFMSNWKED